MWASFSGVSICRYVLGLWSTSGDYLSNMEMQVFVRRLPCVLAKHHDLIFSRPRNDAHYPSESSKLIRTYLFVVLPFLDNGDLYLPCNLRVALHGRVGALGPFRRQRPSVVSALVQPLPPPLSSDSSPSRIRPHPLRHSLLSMSPHSKVRCVSYAAEAGRGASAREMLNDG